MNPHEDCGIGLLIPVRSDSCRLALKWYCIYSSETNTMTVRLSRIHTQQTHLRERHNYVEPKNYEFKRRDVLYRTHFNYKLFYTVWLQNKLSCLLALIKMKIMRLNQYRSVSPLRQASVKNVYNEMPCN